MTAFPSPNRADILARLKRDILPLQGYKPAARSAVDLRLGAISHAFPHGVFPLGAVHEFTCAGAEEAAAATGFVSGILGALLQKPGTAIWVGAKHQVFPPALQHFGIDPH